MTPRLFALVLCSAPVFSASAAVAQAAMSYDECIATAQSSPQAALSLAQNWRASGGGGAAQHCRAMALAAMGSFAEAARAVEQLAQETGDGGTQADLYAQAGDFQMAASDAAEAKRLFARALSVDPGNVVALDGRARSAAAQGDFAGAVEDLNRLLWLVPNDAEALSLRAAARRQTGDVAGALADADAAVAADPASAVAYFERGAARAVTGDRQGARDDWQRSQDLDPGGEIGQLAATNRARLP